MNECAAFWRDQLATTKQRVRCIEKALEYLADDVPGLEDNPRYQTVITWVKHAINGVKKQGENENGCKEKERPEKESGGDDFVECSVELSEASRSQAV